jgi:hypothetical protein
LFGTQHVGAIHGRLLTAWSVAGILGPVVVNYIREFQLAHGVPASQAYNTTLYILAGFLLLGSLCNLLVRPVAADRFMNDEQLARERALAHEVASREQLQAGEHQRVTPVALVVMAWIAVGVPMAWGIWTTIIKALPLFR